MEWKGAKSKSTERQKKNRTAMVAAYHVNNYFNKFLLKSIFRAQVAGWCAQIFFSLTWQSLDVVAVATTTAVFFAPLAHFQII